MHSLTSMLACFSMFKGSLKMQVRNLVGKEIRSRIRTKLTKGMVKKFDKGGWGHPILKPTCNTAAALGLPVEVLHSVQ